MSQNSLAKMAERRVAVSSDIEQEIGGIQESIIQENRLQITAKGAFNWSSCFESLKRFVDVLINDESKWTSPGGGYKQFENENITLRWYPYTTSLTIKGKGSENLNQQLLSIARESTEEIKHLQAGDTEDEVTYEVEDEASITNVQTTEDEVESLELKMNILENKFGTQMEELRKQLRVLTEAREKSNTNTEYISALERRNETLEQENQVLREKTTQLTCIISDLNTRVKDLSSDIPHYSVQRDAASLNIQGAQAPSGALTLISILHD